LCLLPRPPNLLQPLSWNLLLQPLSRLTKHRQLLLRSTTSNPPHTLSPLLPRQPNTPKHLPRLPNSSTDVEAAPSTQPPPPNAIPTTVPQNDHTMRTHANLVFAFLFNV
jgi:hypothetical protein